MAAFYKVEGTLVVEAASQSGSAYSEKTIIAFWGEEAISKPYRWRIRTAVGSANANTYLKTSLVGRGASFTYTLTNTSTNQSRSEAVHGVVFEVRICGSTVVNAQPRLVVEFLLKPRLAKLGLNRHSQIYGIGDGLDRPSKILERLLQPATARTNTLSASIYAGEQPLYVAGGTSGHTYDMNQHMEQQVRAMFVQFQESDLDFASRLLEREGIFYFFRETASGEQLVVSADHATFPAVSGTIPLYKDEASGQQAGPTGCAYAIDAIMGFGSSASFLKDYNYTAADSADATHPGDASFNNSLKKGEYKSQAGVITGSYEFAGTDDLRAWGARTFTDEDVTTPEDNPPDESNLNRIARVRLEEAICWQNRTDLTTNSPALRPGYIFTLTDQSGASLNLGGTFLVVASAVSYVDPQAGPNGLPGADPETFGAFVNRVTCIDGGLAFRPRRSTPRPTIPGILVAGVSFASSVDAGTSDMDPTYNTYTIRLIDEESTTTRLPDGSTSPPVRQAQFYGGGETATGTAFPLMDETEVAIAFVHGDPDRPVIVGTLRNAAAEGVTAGVTPLDPKRLNRLLTSSGAVLEIYDGD